MSNDRTPEKPERQTDRPEGSTAFNAMDLLKEGSKGGDVAAFARLSAMIRDPQGLEKAGAQFKREFEKAVAADSPEPLQRLARQTEERIAAMNKYMANLQSRVDDKAALV
ncbi:MAG: hypothetical protein HY711_05590 [Candidatus Melainabacteria bacterium]|nr:hypothetical protein [Candidatus Melainabacteria bacterium]